MNDGDGNSSMTSSGGNNDEKCHSCGSLDHIKKDCLKPLRPSWHTVAPKSGCP